MTTNTLFGMTNSGRMALTCGCGVTEKVKPAFADRRRIFCGNCRALLRQPDGRKKAAAPAAPAKEVIRRRSSHEEQSAGRVTRSRAPRQEERPARFHRNPSFERHVVAIGVMYRLLGVLSVLASLALVALTGPAAMVGLLVAGAILVVGHGLTRYNPVCRWLLVALAVLGLLSATYGAATGSKGIVAGLISYAWNGGILWALLSSDAQRIFAPEFRGIVARSPEVHVPWWSSPFFFVPAGLFFLSLLALAVTLLTAL